MAIETKFTKEELEASLKRAFGDGKADYIEMDGHSCRSRFLVESVDYGVNQGWIYRAKDKNEDDVLGAGMGQWSAMTYRLTAKGKKYFGLKK